MEKNIARLMQAICCMRILHNDSWGNVLRTKWILNKWQLLGLTLYSCAFPLGIYLEKVHHVPHAFLISLINLPFLLIVWPVFMSLAMPLSRGPLFIFYFLAWAVIFVQSYLAFVYLHSRSARVGISTSKALISSIGRLAVISLITLVVGGLFLVLLFRLH